MVIGGRYEIVSRLGSGGMSQVFLVEDLRLHVKWTIKRIKVQGGTKSYIAGSVISEANVLRKVRHPSLPRIVDIFKEGDCINLVMEYIEGRTLEEEAARKELNEQQLIDIGLEICSALKCLHSMKPPVIYRDMKPSNIMVRPDGHICLIDFGTAKRFVMNKGGKDTTLLGTYGFAAPEQYSGRTDERSDIYSLGMTLKACSGRKISRNFKKLIEKCTSDRPEDRYRNVEELSEGLKRLRHRKTRLIVLYICAAMLLITLSGVVYGINAGNAMAQVMENTISGADLYMRYVQSGNEAVFNGDYSLAEHDYTLAIVEADPGRATAYLQLLKLYRKLGLSSEGLDRIDSLIRDNEFLAERDGIYYECALAAYYDCSDIKRASAYLSGVDPGLIPEAAYLSNLFQLTATMDMDMKKIAEILRQFKAYNATLPPGEEHIENDINIAGLYLTYCDEIDQITGGETCLMDAAQLTKEAMELTMDDEKVIQDYLLKELGMLSTIYRLLGSRFEDKRELYYNQAIDYSRQFLREPEAYENDGEIRMKLLYMARMYEDMKCYGDALKCYAQSEERYPYEGIEIYLGHLKCLIRMGAGKEEIKRVYEEASRVEGIRSNPEYIRLKNEIAD